MKNNPQKNNNYFQINSCKYCQNVLPTYLIFNFDVEFLIPYNYEPGKNLQSAFNES